jgi:hypothetical protein
LELWARIGAGRRESRISDHNEGIHVAVEILYMRLFSDQGRISPNEFIEIGCELMRRLNITADTGPNFAQRLQIIGKPA